MSAHFTQADIYLSYDVITYVAQVVYKAYTPLSKQYTDRSHGSGQYIADSGVVYTISHTSTGSWSIYQRTKTNAKPVHSTAGLYFRYTAHQTWCVFASSAFARRSMLFPHPTGWRTIAETLTTLPHWLELTQTHSVSITSSICS